MPSSPRAWRCRGTALTAAALMALPAGSPLPVAADDLNQRKHAVERRIEGAGRELDQSSVDLTRATRALAATESRLRAAKAAVSITRAQLVAARALDDQAQGRLGTAEEALSAATNDVDRVGLRIRAQEDALRQIVLQTYQDGTPSLMALSMVLTSREPVDLSGQLNSVQNVVSKESATLDGLDATQAVFLVKQRELAVATASVARQRAAAARMLLRRRSLGAHARRTERQIHALVVDRETQRRGAVKAWADDQQQLRDLQRERDRVSALLRRHAAEARRRAVAEALPG